MKFAAIDIGSNAVRAMFMNIFINEGKPAFKKVSLVRVPVRLGDDAFIKGYISENKIKQLIKTMKSFKGLMDVHKVKDYHGCATSAMREAGNGPEIVKRIKKEAGIDIDIINGKEEAGIIYSTHIADMLDQEKNYLYIDVGGGSTEVTLFHKGRQQGSKSFNIGTVRILEKGFTDKNRKEMEEWMKKIAQKYHPLDAIGTGGNINSYFKISGNKTGEPLHLTQLKKMHSHIKSHSYKERITKLLLNPDRADVIIPAGEIFLSIMKWAGINKIYVPKVGLVDGIMYQFYEAYRDEILDEEQELHN